MIAKNKTIETLESVPGFINKITDKTKLDDSFRMIKLIQKQTGFKPKMWGPSIIGFGTCHYKYESGREGDMPIVGFSPRSAALVFYLSSNFEKRDALLQKLGKYKTSKSCIYIKKLEDINIEVLMKMVTLSVKHRQSLDSMNNNKK